MGLLSRQQIVSAAIISHPVSRNLRFRAGHSPLHPKTSKTAQKILNSLIAWVSTSLRAEAA